MTLGRTEARLARARLEGIIREIGTRFVRGQSEQAHLKVLRAEADLSSLLARLRRAFPGDARLPDDVLSLVPRDDLRSSLEGARARRRQFAVFNAEYPTAETKSRLRWARTQELRIENALRTSPEIKNGYDELVREANKKNLIGRRGVDQAMARREYDRLVKRSKAAGMVRTEVLPANGSRAPPRRLLDSKVLDVIRKYDVDVNGWAHSNARLRAFAGAVEAGKNWRVTCLQFADDATVARARGLLQQMHARIEALPVTAHPNEARHVADWLGALREADSARKRPGYQSPRRPDANALRHLRSPSLSREAKGKFLAVVQERFRQDSRRMPPATNREFRRILTGVGHQHLDNLRQLLSKSEIVADKLVRSTGDVSGRARNLCLEARKKLKVAAARTEAAVLRVEQLGGRLDAGKKRALLVARAGFGPENFPGAPAASPRAAPPTGGSRPLLASDPDLSRAIRQAEVSLKEARKALGAADYHTRSLDLEPPRFGKSKGRLSITRVSISGNRPNWRRSPRDPNATRLPARLRDWKGRLRPDGTPFDYKKQVLDFKSFRPVGGGIHLGQVAKNDTDADLSDWALVYDSKREALVLNSHDGTSYALPGVDPAVLKPLYRFVAAGRNAAISIGWALEKVPLTRSMKEIQELGEPVLLDPYLVDTPIGQDLVMADTVPWQFGKAKLPNGATLSFRRKFSDSYHDFRSKHTAPLRRILAKLAKHPPMTGQGSEKESLFWKLLNELERGPCTRTTLERFAACCLETDSGMKVGKLIDGIVAILDPTTLAVLFDGPSHFRLEDGKIKLNGSMRYRYATQPVTVDSDYVYVGAGSGRGAKDVVTIERLTEVANAGFEEISSKYPPIERVEKAARLAAFLRWAQKARSAGALGRIDLSALAPYPASNRSEYPTPDALK